MKTAFEVAAEVRGAEQGKGASRRLRRAGKVPAILYGGNAEPTRLLMDHQRLLLLLDNERFYTAIIAVKMGDKTQPAILKDLQRHPAKNQILHLDLQRVLDDQPIRMTVPLHFKNAAIAPGVKTQGGIVSHLRSEVEVLCLPKDLPEFLELDMAEMEIGAHKYLSDLPLPAGVQLVELTHGRDTAVVSIHHPRAAEEAPAEAVVAAAAAPAAADAKPGAAKPAAAKPGAKPAAAAAPKKDGGKK